jgi:hypothetical protein
MEIFKVHFIQPACQLIKEENEQAKIKDLDLHLGLYYIGNKHVVRSVLKQVNWIEQGLDLVIQFQEEKICQDAFQSFHDSPTTPIRSLFFP